MEAASVPALPTGKKELEQFRAVLLGEGELPRFADPEVMAQAIVERILESETFEDAFQPQELEAWRDYLDVPVLVKGVHLNRSGYEGTSIYAVVDIERVDGKDPKEPFTVTCGGRNVLAQLYKMLEKDWLDKPVKMTSRTTAEGFNALWLVAA